MKQLRPVLKWALALLLVGALALAGTRLLRNKSSTTQASSYSQTYTVARGNLTASVSPTGQVSPTKRVALSVDVTKLPLVELNVTAGQEVKKGDVLARIDPSSLEQAVQQAQADLLSAEEALDKAKKPYTDLDLQKAELDVSQAEAALAEARLSTVGTAVADAARTLQQAKAKLTAVQNDTATRDQLDRLRYQANVAEVEHGKLLEGSITTDEGRDRELLAYNKMMDAKDNLETTKARAALDLLNAQNAVTEAEGALAKAKGGSGALQISNHVAQAEYNLAKANDSLATIQAGPGAKTVQLAQAKYDAAKATLEKAQKTLTSATIVAPFDGTVVAVGAEVGDLVSAGTSIVTLADLSKMEVVAGVDETDISQVRVGQAAQITFDAITGKTFTGKVLEVPLQGTLSSSVVTYQVRLSLEGAEGVSLRSGMTANVKIITGQRQNVLLVPLLAITQEDTGDVVLVQDSTGTAATTPVQVGLNDGTYAEVLRGLNEGDVVVVQYEAATTQQNQFRGGEMMIEVTGGGGPPPNLPGGN
jgi:HlyD family secretion protein